MLDTETIGDWFDAQGEVDTVDDLGHEAENKTNTAVTFEGRYFKIPFDPTIHVVNHQESGEINLEFYLLIDGIAEHVEEYDLQHLTDEFQGILTDELVKYNHDDGGILLVKNYHEPWDHGQARDTLLTKSRVLIRRGYLVMNVLEEHLNGSSGPETSDPEPRSFQ